MRRPGIDSVGETRAIGFAPPEVSADTPAICEPTANDETTATSATNTVSDLILIHEP